VLRGALHEARRHLRPGSAPRTAIRTLKTQLLALRQLAERAGSQIARKYVDHGISGAKGGDQRPGVDRLLKGATRRQFDLGLVPSSVSTPTSNQPLMRAALPYPSSTISG